MRDRKYCQLEPLREETAAFSRQLEALDAALSLLNLTKPTLDILAPPPREELAPMRMGDDITLHRSTVVA
jgi:hypothetical protein